MNIVHIFFFPFPSVNFFIWSGMEWNGMEKDSIFQLLFVYLLVLLTSNDLKILIFIFIFDKKIYYKC